jgi:hypothetical protein
MERRGSAGRFAWVWLVLAVLAIGGFLSWLGVNAQPGTVAVVEEAEETPVDFGAAEAVALDDLAANSTAYLGRAVRVDALPVSSRLGGYAFWAVATNGMPFLAKLEKGLVEGGLAVQDGQHLTVVGQVREMSAAVLDSWEQEGILSTADDRMVAEFAETYLEIVQAKQASGATPSE